MHDRISSAVIFIEKLVRKGYILPDHKIQLFSENLRMAMFDHFTDHWYSDQPFRGQGYRCIRHNSSMTAEPLIEKAAIHSGVSYEDLCLPAELTIWVDPDDVCYRFGEVTGSYCTVSADDLSDDGEIFAKSTPSTPTKTAILTKPLSSSPPNEHRSRSCSNTPVKSSSRSIAMTMPPPPPSRSTWFNSASMARLPVKVYQTRINMESSLQPQAPQVVDMIRA